MRSRTEFGSKTSHVMAGSRIRFRGSRRAIKGAISH